MKMGIFSGSFDPPTIGHVWLGTEAAKLFDELHVIVGYHPRKKHLIPKGERVKLIMQCFNLVPRIQIIETRDVSAYACNMAFAGHTVALVRGIRSEQDYAYEERIVQMNFEIARRVGVSLQQILLPAPKSLADVSSSVLRYMIKTREWEKVRTLVPDCVFQFLLKEVSAEDNSHQSA